MPRPPTKLREEILDAAIKLLREEGERAMTQTRVARAAGIPQGHLTYYFPRKRDLILGVADHFARVTAHDIMEFFGERRELPIRDVLLAYTVRLSQDRERTRMLLGLLVMSEREPALADVIASNAANLRALLAPILRRTVDDPLVDLMLAVLWGLGLHEFVLRTGTTETLTSLAIALLESKKTE